MGEFAVISALIVIVLIELRDVVMVSVVFRGSYKIRQAEEKVKR